MRKFGVEFEYAGGAGGVLSHLYDEGLAAEDRFHDYHCRCATCRYNNYLRGSLFFAQEDCTADGEIITRILQYGSDDANRAIRSIAEGVRKARAAVNEDVGMHVHVDATTLDTPDRVRVCRIFLRYQDDLALLASGHFRGVREYNQRLTLDHVAGNSYFSSASYARQQLAQYERYAAQARADESLSSHNVAYYESMVLHWRMELADAEERERTYVDWWEQPAEVAQYIPPGRYWLADCDDTFEFRLWNATRNEWRIRMAVGVSCAIVQAGADGVDVSENDERSLLQVLSPYLDADIFGGILRQLTYKEAVA